MDPVYFFLALAAGAVLLVGYAKLTESEQQSFWQRGVQTEGLVVRNKFIWGRICVIRPIIQFRTQQGQLIEALDEHGAAFAIPRFTKGQKVIVIYEQENPRNFRILSSGMLA